MTTGQIYHPLEWLTALPGSDEGEKGTRDSSFAYASLSHIVEISIKVSEPPLSYIVHGVLFFCPLDF